MFKNMTDAYLQDSEITRVLEGIKPWIFLYIFWPMSTMTVLKGWCWQYMNASPWKRLPGVLPQLLAEQSQALAKADSSGQDFLLDFANYSSAVVQHNTVLKIQWEITGTTCTTAWTNHCLDMCVYVGDHISQLVCTILHFHGVQEMVRAAPKATEQSGLLNPDLLQRTIYRQCARQTCRNQLWFCRAPSLKQHKPNAQLFSFMTGQRHSWQCEGLLTCRPMSPLLVSATSLSQVSRELKQKCCNKEVETVQRELWGFCYSIKKEMSPSKNSTRRKKEVRRRSPLCGSSVALFCRDVGMITEV